MSGKSFLPGIRPVHADPSAWASSAATQRTPVLPAPVPKFLPSASVNPYQQPPVVMPPSFTTPYMTSGAPPTMFASGFPTPIGAFPPPMSVQPAGFYPGTVVPAFAAATTILQEEDDTRKVGNDGTIAEQLFPPGRIADLDKAIAVSKDRSLIGLEYVIEIQHNTIKKMQNSYSCLLCDHQIKVPKDDINTVQMMLNHVKSSQHKLAYLKKFFPRINRKLIGNTKPIDHNLVNSLILKIIEKFGLMKVKIVVGQKLFKKKAVEIKEMIEKSSHHSEDDTFVFQLCGELVPLTPKTRIDEYADAFEAFEKEEKGISARKPSTAQSNFFGVRDERDLDNLPLKGINPIGQGVVDPKSETTVKRRSRTRSPSKSKAEPGRFQRKRSRTRSPARNSKRSRSRSKSHKPGKSKQSRSRSPRTRRSKSPRRRRHSKSPKSRRSRSRSRRSRSKRTRSRTPKPRRSRSRDRHTRKRSRSRSKDRKAKSRKSKSPSRPRSKRTRSKSRDRGSKKPVSPKRSPLPESKKVESAKRSLTPPKEKKKSMSPDFTLSIEKLQAELDAKVKLFLEEDRLLFTELELEKTRFRDNPEDHPDYSEEWRRFYNEKCIRHGTKINPSLLKGEWAEAWDIYLNRAFDQRMTRRRETIMDRLKLRKDDIEDYLYRQKLEAAKVPVSPVSSIEDNIHYNAPPPPTRSRSPSSRGAHAPAASSASKGRNLEFSRDEVSVINTLRLLSAIENLLDDLGIQILQSLGRANTMEVNSGFGESAQLVNDRPFFKMLQEAKKKLQAKLIEAGIPEKSQNVVRICIDHITILLQQSRCVPTPPPKPIPVDPDSQLKEVIAQTIRDEYYRAGVALNEEELSALVLTQYRRVCEKRNRPATPPPKAVNPNPPLMPNFDWDAVQSAVTACSQISVKQERLDLVEPDIPTAIRVKKERFESYQEELAAQAAYSGGPPDQTEGEEDSYDDLTVDELVSLFQNFKDLDKDNQEQLIIYMKKLEKSNPEKVNEIKSSLNAK